MRTLHNKSKWTSKLTTMYKIYNIDYLSQIIPNTRGDDSVYRTRIHENYSWPKCRIELFMKYFVPGTRHKSTL